MSIEMRLLVVAALACLAPATSTSQPVRARTPPEIGGQYVKAAWTTEDGLPQNTITALLQTRDGYLWVGTGGGLARFDGARFTVFKSGNTPGLRSNRIRALYEDRDGSLWIGADGGGLTRYQRGTFSNYSTGNGLPGDRVVSLAGDLEGGLWVGTGEGVARFRDGIITALTTNQGLPREVIRAICQERQGAVWLGTERGKVIRFGQGAVTAYAIPGRPLNDWVNVIHEGRDGGIWVGAQAGLFRFEGGKLSPIRAPDGWPFGAVNSICEDEKGTLLVGTDRGLVRVSGGVADGLARQGLSDPELQSVLIDREGNLWLGANVGGLNRWSRRSLVTYAGGQAQSGENVLRICEDREGTVWVGSFGGGLSHFKSGELIRYPLPGGLFNTVWAMWGDRDGDLWLGNFKDGLGRVRDGQLIRYTAAEGLSDNGVFSIYQDAEGALWVGTERGGLNRFKDGKFTAYRTADGLPHDQISFITQDREGALWLGTPRGASRFKDGRFTNYGNEAGLVQVRAIHQDADGAIWVGTYGYGLSRLKGGRWTRYTEKDGLFDDVVSRILEDDRGNLWMSGNKGIFRAGRAELDDFAEGRVKAVSCVSYGVADGMKTAETNGGGQPAGWKARDGRLWFPTIKGVVVVDPQQVNELPPPVVIEEVMLDRESRPPGREVRINPGQEDLEVRYTGLSFRRPEHVRFRYRLEGLNQEWVEAGARRTAYYQHLPPGDYTFRVIAANGDGVWNLEGAALRVVVVPPFYRTWWFLTAAVLAVAAIAVLAYKARVAKLRRAHATQELFSRQLIDSQEGERQRIAAELHDSLGQNLLVIKNQALLGTLAAPDPAAARRQFTEISSAATQAIDEVRQIAYNLRPYHLDSLGLTQSLEVMFEKVERASGIGFSHDLAALDGLVPKEWEINLYRIVQEAVNNIVKHSGATRARVEVAREGRGILITVRDNGKGFAPEAAGDGRRRGFGLTGIAERVRMLGGTQAIESAPGGGTALIVRLDLRGAQEGGRDEG